MSNNMIFKRIFAYLIDFLVVTFVSMALATLTFLNPKYEEYSEISEKYTEYTEAYYEKEIDATKYASEIRELSYDMNKNGYVYIIGDIVIAFLYFGVFQYVTKGQTLGKKIMNIKVVSNKEDKDLKITNYFIRAFILNGVILNIVILVAICFKRSVYYQIFNVGSNFNSILSIVLFLSVLFSASGRGLHDVMAGTKVIDLKQSASLENKDEEIIKPKKKNNKDE